MDSKLKSNYGAKDFYMISIILQQQNNANKAQKCETEVDITQANDTIVVEAPFIACHISKD